MKKLLFILTFLATGIHAMFAQAPGAIPYQAVARNAAGNLVTNQNVSLRFSVHDGTAGGPVVYQETHSATTNELGLFTVNVGQGTPVSGTFVGINWGSGAKFMQIELDPAGGASYINMGTSQMMSVPYAIHSGNGMPGGSAPGEMLYWDGSAWQKINPGTHAQTLTLCNGVPTWGACLQVSTDSVTNIAVATATSGGLITNNTGGTITARGVCWNTSGNPVNTDAHTTDGTGAGAFTSQITGLSQNTQYYVRAYATNAIGTTYGNEVSFTTIVPGVPTVTTTAVSSILQGSASVGGNVTNDGYSAVTARGICWNTTGSPTISGPKTTNGSGLGTFSSSITGLTYNTTYYVRAYATNAVGTAYGNEVIFITLQQAPPTAITDNKTLNASSFTFACSVTNDGGANVTSRGFCFDTAAAPTTSKRVKLSGSGTGGYGVTIPHDSLLRGLKYYGRAFATNSLGTSYGSEIQFMAKSSSCNGFNGIKIGNQCWSEFDVNVGTFTTGSLTDNGVLEKNCPCNVSDNCSTYGALYTAGEATQYNAAPGSQGICPSGWHVPDLNEWNELIDNLPGVTMQDKAIAIKAEYTTVNPGGLWLYQSGIPSGSNESGFRATPSTCNPYGLVGNYLTSDNNVVSIRYDNSLFTGSGSSGKLRCVRSPYGPGVVTTAPVTNITSTTATCGGNVISDNGSTINDRAIIWNTTGNPNFSTGFTGVTWIPAPHSLGAFVGSMTGLQPNTTYYVRAALITREGTYPNYVYYYAYGEEMVFTTAP